MNLVIKLCRRVGMIIQTEHYHPHYFVKCFFYFFFAISIVSIKYSSSNFSKFFKQIARFCSYFTFNHHNVQDWILLHVSPTSLILETYYGDFISRVRVRFRYKVISIILVSWYVKEPHDWILFVDLKSNDRSIKSRILWR